MALAQYADNYESLLAVGYAAGSGTIRLSEGTGAVLADKLRYTVSSTHPIRFTVVDKLARLTGITPETNTCVFKATSLTGDTLTGVVADTGWTDTDFLAGDGVWIWWTVEAVNELQDAISAAGGTAFPIGGDVIGGTAGRFLVVDTGPVLAELTPAQAITALGAKSPVRFSFGGTDSPATGTDLCPWLDVPYATTVTKFCLSVKTPPTGNFTVTVKRSADGGSTFPDTVATVSVGAGLHLASTTSITTPSLAAGNYLRLDISAVNGAADWSARLTGLTLNQ